MRRKLVKGVEEQSIEAKRTLKTNGISDQVVAEQWAHQKQEQLSLRARTSRLLSIVWVTRLIQRNQTRLMY